MDANVEKQITALASQIKTLEDRLKSLEIAALGSNEPVCKTNFVVGDPCRFICQTCQTIRVAEQECQLRRINLVPCGYACQSSCQTTRIVSQACELTEITIGSGTTSIGPIVTECMNDMLDIDCTDGKMVIGCGVSSLMTVPFDWKDVVLGDKIKTYSPDSKQILLGELQQGKVRIESNMAMITPENDVSIRLDNGSIISAKSLSSTIIGLASPIEVLLEVSEKGMQKIIGGKLILANGDYKKGVGITISAGSDAMIQFMGIVYNGKICEEVVIGMNMLRTRPASIGIKRITN